MARGVPTVRCLVFLMSICACGSGCNQEQPSANQPDAPRDERSEVSVPTETVSDTATPQRPPGAATGETSLGAISLTAPPEWIAKQPAVSFILAEYALPRAEGDEEDGRLTVSVAGGSIEDNIQRWRGQFAGSLESESTEEISMGNLKATLVDFAGEFNDQRGPFAPAQERPGYRMLAAIIPVDGQLHFIKCTGPANTLAAHVDTFQAFVRSARRN